MKQIEQGVFLSLLASAVLGEQPDGKHADPLGGDSMLGNLSKFLLASTEFQPLEESARNVWGEAMAELNQMNPEDIHSGFMVVLTKRPGGEFCAFCNKVHEKDGIRQYVLGVGPYEDLRLSAEVALSELHSQKRRTSTY